MKRLLITLTFIFSLLPFSIFNPQSSIFNLQSSPFTLHAQDHPFDVAKHLDIFNALYRELDLFYVDSIDVHRSMLIGIDAMLEDLDPYTEYYSEEDMGDLKMITTGKYGGIGSIIRMKKDSTVIIGEPYANMPAAEVGLQVGDVLLQIDTIDLKGKVTSEVSELLRGEPGTTFTLKVQRPGENLPQEFRITRRNIKVPAIPYYGILPQGDVGYISLTQFTEGCSQDVATAIAELKDKGAKSLILDLRGNGGGLINEAVSIVNLFVKKDTKIVETKGKVESANATYTTRREPIDTNIPLVILVNGSSASASEIVSGALQDFHRATIIGTRTYGKGLVQSTRQLPYNGGLKLTTAKYYLPSGRCIQAIDYKQRREAKTDKAASRDSLGGILPDIVMHHDTLANMLYYLSNDDVLVDWGTHYMQTHPQLPAVKDFQITDTDFNELRQMAKDADFKYDRLSEKRLEDLKKMAKFEGYYDDAKPEFDALEKKLEHNLDRDFDIHQHDIRKIMAQEVVKRFAFQAGCVEESLKDDEDINKAIETLATKK
ncbi:MAG: S41 family peptidase [Bacteroidaceae bacterium]|nr:S41 family peptidase [Bacteroidaceae bacterium]